LVELIAQLLELTHILGPRAYYSNRVLKGVGG